MGIVAFFASLVDPFYLVEGAEMGGEGILSFGGDASRSSSSGPQRGTKGNPGGTKVGNIRVKTLADLPSSGG